MITLNDKQWAIMQGKICPYCNSDTEFVDSSEIYNGTSFGMIYLCRLCRAWVGVHKGTNNSLGRLANHELREYKKELHAHFDIIWKSKLMGRTKAYKWLSKKLKIPFEYTHVGMFSVGTCQKAIEIVKQFLQDNKLQLP
jgi:hypothetical protein